MKIFDTIKSFIDKAIETKRYLCKSLGFRCRPHQSSDIPISSL